MNTVFSGNQVGSRVGLDITYDYSTGLLAALFPYPSPSQELIQAQVNYTANQADIKTQIDAALGNSLSLTENTATVAPNSANSQVAAMNYINAASALNYMNQNLSDLANTAYANSHAVFKISNDASYSAYLVQEAYQVYLNKVSTAVTVVSLGDTTPDVNPIDVTTLSTISTTVSVVESIAQNQVTLASNNIQSYLTNTAGILSDAITKSSSVSSNLTLLAAINGLVQAVTRAVVDPLNEISGKELLVTQYVPSPPINNAVDIATTAFASLTAFIAAINAGVQTSANIVSSVGAAGTLATSLDSTARPLDVNMYLKGALNKSFFKSISTLKDRGGIIHFPNDPAYTPTYVSRSYNKIASEAKVIALAADLSASNARTVSNSLITLKNAFQNTVTPEPSVYPSLVKASYLINNLLLTLKKVTSNSSAAAAVAITRRAANTVMGDLHLILENENKSLDAANDATNVTTLLQYASTLAPTLLNSNMKTLNVYLLAINAAKSKAEEVTEKLKNHAYLLSINAHSRATPSRIAVQTHTANRLGIDANNALSRLARNSAAPPSRQPEPYSSYKADIRAKTFIPVRPSLDELVFRNRISPLTLNSINTIEEFNIKVAQQVQYINTRSGHSFMQQ